MLLSGENLFSNWCGYQPLFGFFVQVVAAWINCCAILRYSLSLRNIHGIWYSVFYWQRAWKMGSKGIFCVGKCQGQPHYLDKHLFWCCPYDSHSMLLLFYAIIYSQGHSDVVRIILDNQALDDLKNLKIC